MGSNFELIKGAMTDELVYEIHIGHQIVNYLEDVASFRIKYFKDYPYLYVGDQNYERKYLSGFANDSKGLLILVKQNKKIIAVSTGVPLVTNSDILDGAEDGFRSKKLNPFENYYYGEVIIDYAFRGRGIIGKVYELQETFAKSQNFKSVAIATVVRSDDDIRRPENYRSSDPLWLKLGFNRTGIQFNFNWPTIREDLTISDCSNCMEYWIKIIG